jgi:hypothetical protein
MSLRDGWRLAGMKSEITYLASERFTGRAIYWREGEELRRRLTFTDMGDNGMKKPELPSDPLINFQGRLEQWIRTAETKIKMLFSHGVIKKIEF